MKNEKRKLSKFKAIYFWLFFLLCSYQIVTTLFSLNVGFTSAIVRILFILGYILIILELYYNHLLLRYTKKILLHYYVLVTVLLLHFCYYTFFYMERFDFLGRSSVSYTQSFILGMLAWTVIGSAFYISIHRQDLVKKQRKTKKYIPLISIIILLIFVISNKGISELDYSKVRELSSLSITHLTLGSFAVYPLIYLQTSSKNLGVYVTLMLNTIILYMIGGRADLVLYLLTSIIYYSFIIKNNKLTIYSSIFSLICFLLLSIVITTKDMTLPFISNIFSVFDDTDSSKSARRDIMNNNISDLPNKIFFGDPNYFILSYDNLGTYTHNILSMWEFFGFITFLILLSFLYKVIKYLRVNREQLKKTQTGKFAIFFIVFIIFQILTSKPVVYYPLWFIIGFTAMLIALNKNTLKDNM